jgi:hypothetical protein
MKIIQEFYKANKDKVEAINRIIFVTDRLGLDDSQKTSPYRIREWKHSQWKNFEGKPIKNSDLLEELDKQRRKVIQDCHCSTEIQYQRRKYNKAADKASRKGRDNPLIDKSIEIKGQKIGKRLFKEDFIDYGKLQVNMTLIIHIYLKQPVREEWEISAEIINGENAGQKICMYVDNVLEQQLHRHHHYQVIIIGIYQHHIRISQQIQEITKP